MHFTWDGLTLYTVLKTIDIRKLISLLIAALIAAPPVAFPSHMHLVGGGDGQHAIVAHTCGKDEVHRELHSGETCLACLRTGFSVALFSDDSRGADIAPVGLTMQVVNLRPTESEELACPKRGPPTSHF